LALEEDCFRVVSALWNLLFERLFQSALASVAGTLGGPFVFRKREFLFVEKMGIEGGLGVFGWKPLERDCAEMELVVPAEDKGGDCFECFDEFGTPWLDLSEPEPLDFLSLIELLV